MATATQLEFHPAANIFPLDDETLDELAEDIKQHGQMIPVELCDGKILDGRRRYMACRMADIEPEFTTVSPDDPIAYVLSLNLHRRHLTPSQKAMVVARVRDLYDRDAKERQKLSEGRGHKKGVENLPHLNEGKARDQAGKAVGVSGKTVDYASKVLEKGTPELIKAVDEGRMAVSTAAILASEPEDVQREAVADPKRNRTYTSLAKSPEKNESETTEPEPGKSRGVGVARANEAIDCLKRIPKNDALRKRGFQIVTDWIRHNK